MIINLTERELEILKLIAHGHTNKQISCILYLSLSTVENHIHHIYTKLRISNRAQAVIHAFRMNLTFEEYATDIIEK